MEYYFGLPSGVLMNQYKSIFSQYFPVSTLLHLKDFHFGAHIMAGQLHLTLGLFRIMAQGICSTLSNLYRHF
jgi:hypothetical protein